MFHKIFVVGNLGRDPEMRYTPNGQAVTSFPVAVNRRYNDSNGQPVEETIWFRISAWGKQAELCKQYLSKGRQVLVEGRLNPDRATGNPRTFTRQDGSVGSSYEVVAETVRFLGGRGEGTESADTSAAAPAPSTEEEIPF
ncbi:MAG: single-stranded DNA-binding protein [Anaerolineales bacterium]|jgi:single-strand DNA-binding protein